MHSFFLGGGGREIGSSEGGSEGEGYLVIKSSPACGLVVPAR